MEASRSLFNRGFNSLLLTQFLGAANDNILKQCLTFMVATGIWSGSLAEGGLGEGGQVIPDAVSDHSLHSALGVCGPDRGSIQQAERDVGGQAA